MDLKKVKRKSNPQDTRVKLIDAELLNQVLVCPARDNSSFKLLNEFTVHTEEFPDLSCTSKPRHRNPIPDLSFNDGNREKPTTITKEDENCLRMLSKKSAKKQPKSSDPILIDVMEFLQGSVKKRHPYQGTPFHQNEKKKYGPHNSTNFFKKGKQRETPSKKRYSRLKLVILEERKKKQCNNEKVVEQTCDNNLDCIDVESGPICSNEKMKENEIPCASDIRNCRPENEEINEKIFCTIIGRNGEQRGKEDCWVEELSLANKEANVENDQSNAMLPQLKYEKESQNSCSKECQLISHSRKFREYCHNMKSQDLDDAVASLLRELCKFQDRLFKKDPIRAHAKRRLVFGIREVKKYLKLKKLRVVIMAPDIETINSPGGLDDAVAHIKEEGKLQEIPIVFAASRQKLGYVTMKKVPVSVVGIMNYDGAEELLKLMLGKWKTACDLYKENFGLASPSQRIVAVNPDHSKNNITSELTLRLLSKLKDSEEFVRDKNASEDGIDELQDNLYKLVV